MLSLTVAALAQLQDGKELQRLSFQPLGGKGAPSIGSIGVLHPTFLLGDVIAHCL